MDAKSFCLKLENFGNHLDHEGFSDIFTEDGVFRMGNLPAVHGKTNIIEFCKDFVNTLSSMHYEATSVEETPNFIVWQGMATLQRKSDGVSITIPECHIIRREGDKLKEFLVYADASAVLPPSKK